MSDPGIKTPVEINDDEGAIHDADGRYIGIVRMEHAPRVVAALNSHAALVEALEAVRTSLILHKIENASKWGFVGTWDELLEHMRDVPSDIVLIDAALALAGTEAGK